MYEILLIKNINIKKQDLKAYLCVCCGFREDSSGPSRGGDGATNIQQGLWCEGVAAGALGHTSVETNLHGKRCCTEAYNMSQCVRTRYSSLHYMSATHERYSKTVLQRRGDDTMEHN